MSVIEEPVTRARPRWTMPLITAGLRLRERDLTYPAIAVVLEVYHGFEADPESVRRHLLSHGAERRPRGLTPENLRRGS